MMSVPCRDHVLKDTGEGRNEYNDNPAQETETSSGACTTARKASISPDLTNNSTRDRVSCDFAHRTNIIT